VIAGLKVVPFTADDLTCLAPIRSMLECLNGWAHAMPPIFPTGLTGWETAGFWIPFMVYLLAFTWHEWRELRREVRGDN